MKYRESKKISRYLK